MISKQTCTINCKILCYIKYASVVGGQSTGAEAGLAMFAVSASKREQEGQTILRYTFPTATLTFE